MYANQGTSLYLAYNAEASRHIAAGKRTLGMAR